MNKVPKLRIKRVFGYPDEEICELEQARYRFNYGGELVILVEGQAVSSHEELVKIATSDSNKDHEFINVVLLAELVSGG